MRPGIWWRGALFRAFSTFLREVGAAPVRPVTTQPCTELSMCTSGGSGGGAVFHMSTGLWMLSPELPPPFRQRSGCFTTARGAPGRSPRSSTGVSTLVDNSTVVIYEKPCETTENQLNMRLRRDPGGHIDVLCTASSTACGWCGQIIPAPGGLRYGNHPRIHPQPSTGLAPHSYTNYTVDTQFSGDGSAAAATLPDDEFL